jgi:zinc D-Ala-D-Ala dipeptidase
MGIPGGKPPMIGLAIFVHVSSAFGQSARLPADFTFLRDVDPSISQDIRYAGFDNFVGHPLPGYNAAECALRRLAAESLKRVQEELAPRGLSLKVYDCYRPDRAVRGMASWANDGKPSGNKRFFPRFDKSELFARGYIAASSTHSRGISVDLTLVETGKRSERKFDAAASYGPCNGPAEDRAPDDAVDMGTSFDCFDPQSYTASPSITPDQRRWRALLNETMSGHGFKNYYREWWHYTYGVVPGGAALDFLISPRPTLGN